MLNLNNFNWELFNWKFYIEMNKDLKINSEHKAKDHFSKKGFKENRLYSYEQENLYKNYNWEEYLKVNKDLTDNDINDSFNAYIHYIN